MLQPGATARLGQNFTSATGKLHWSFPASACQAQIEAVTLLRSCEYPDRAQEKRKSEHL